MDHFGVVRRAWEITWRYRMLWVFGLLLAACSGGAGGGGGGGNTGYRFNAGDLGRPFGRQFMLPDLAPVVGTILTAIAVAIVLGLLFALIAVVIRYLSETTLIRAVDDYEETGIRRTLGEGIRMGWSWRAARLFLIDLLISIPVGIAFLILILVALSPLLLWVTGSETAGLIGTVATIGLVVLLVMLGLLVAAAISLLRPFFYRAAVLEDLGVFEAISRGFRIVRERFKDAAVMWLIVLGIQIAYALAVAVVLIVLAVAALLVG
ncbi:MAG: DUF7544 domain-containing protein, partial [Anaerolineae bacterium]